MRKFVSRHRKPAALAAAAVALVLFFALRPEPSIRGERDARSDIARGHYVQLGYGLATPWTPEYVRLLRERYGVEYRTVAGCVVSESELLYFHAYNAVSTAAANRKFGHDVFEKSAEESRKSWERTASTAKRE